MEESSYALERDRMSDEHKELHFRFVSFSKIHPRSDKIIDTNRGFLNVEQVSILFCCDNCNWQKWVDINVETLLEGLPKVVPPHECKIEEDEDAD